MSGLLQFLLRFLINIFYLLPFINWNGNVSNSLSSRPFSKANDTIKNQNIFSLIEVCYFKNNLWKTLE